MSGGFSLYELNPGLSPLEVVDLGAFDDPSAPPCYDALMRAGRARVTGFEPNLESCLRLSRTFGPPHRYMPLFVGDGEQATFHLTTRVQTGSLFAPNTPLLQLFRGVHEGTMPVGERHVRTVRLDDVPDLAGADFMKIDVQGAELAALQGAPRMLRSTVAIQIEVAFEAYYSGQPLFADIDRHLRAEGFWFHRFLGLNPITMNPFTEGGNQTLWTDAVYTRSPLQLGMLPGDKLWKLAIVLHDIYGSQDFAYACLREVDARVSGGAANAYRARLAAPPPAPCRRRHGGLDRASPQAELVMTQGSSAGS
jgi:FkbM family methyltransferase